MYDISKEKGKAIERNEDISITYWDLQKTNGNSYISNYQIEKCPYCNEHLEKNFKYCPHCRKEIKQ
ncbi:MULTISPECIES: hypothetical protein [unclassified Clostridium]|uniref:hypothetical protein n=1 Tax=unclassified Clostridium TaxID=2614128 RepID=UPI001E140FD1|nr:zinc-ribbon domain-containing protein [Clostridium botulinum]